MGTRYVHSFTNLIIRYLGIRLYQKQLEKYGNTFSTYIKKNWKGYLDGCVIHRNEGVEKLNEFKIFLNGKNGNLRVAVK